MLLFHDLFLKFCKAYKEEVYGRKYVWIIVGWYNEDWWTKTDVECEGEQMLEAAGSLIETLPLSISASQEPTISNRVCWLEMLLSHNHLFF